MSQQVRCESLIPYVSNRKLNVRRRPTFIMFRGEAIVCHLNNRNPVPFAVLMSGYWCITSVTVCLSWRHGSTSWLLSTSPCSAATVNPWRTRAPPCSSSSPSLPQSTATPSRARPSTSRLQSCKYCCRSLPLATWRCCWSSAVFAAKKQMPWFHHLVWHNL